MVKTTFLDVYTHFVKWFSGIYPCIYCCIANFGGAASGGPPPGTLRGANTRDTPAACVALRATRLPASVVLRVTEAEKHNRNWSPIE